LINKCLKSSPKLIFVELMMMIRRVEFATSN